jgi:predicted nucleic acid-binding protein
MRVALDTNILVYAEGLNGTKKEKFAEQIVDRLSTDDTYLPAQVLGELFRVLVRKSGRTSTSARASLLGWRNSFRLVETSEPIILSAVDLAVRHSVDIWDAVILAATASVGCRLLLSEDFQDGFTWSGVTVANPFASRRNKLLDEILAP